MTHGVFKSPEPTNEPICSFAPGTPERASLQATLASMQKEVLDIPVVAGGVELRGGTVSEARSPHNHGQVLARFHQATEAEVVQAMDAAEAAREGWVDMPWEERAAIFLRAADLLCGPWRDRINASTMLGQSKTCHQAEIDAACELADFWRFNVRYATQLYAEQPESSPGMWNRLEHRPLDGFVLAVTPFNFTSIAGNLPTAPALMGNTTIWKPSSTSVLSNWLLLQLLQEAGLPAGVVNFVPGSGSRIGGITMADRRLAGVHFTGSTATFQTIWRTVSEHISDYAQYPRLVGETGGKDFIFALPDSDREALAVAMARGAFEYQGQKCSAASRAYIPKSMWSDVKEQLAAMVAEMKIGDTSDFSNFMGAVIDAKAFAIHKAAIEGAKQDSTADVIIGGTTDDSVGYFIEPTIFDNVTDDMEIATNEIFGPVMSILSFKDLDEIIERSNSTFYGLAAAVWTRDVGKAHQYANAVKAGTVWINCYDVFDAGAPFGGFKMSGIGRELGAVGLNNYTELKTVTVSLD